MVAGLNVGGSAFCCKDGVAGIRDVSKYIRFCSHQLLGLPSAPLGVKGAALAACVENVDFFVARC